MEYDRYAVIKVKGANPEVFWIIWANSQEHSNFIWKTSQDLAESGVRSELKAMRLAESEIDSLIRRSRERPV